MKKHYFVSIVAILCFAFIHAYTAQGQITKEGIKIRLFTKNDKGKGGEYKIDNTTSKIYLCYGTYDLFDRIEISGKNATISVVIRDGSGDVIYMNKGYNLGTKATFKPFEGHDDLEEGTITILKDDKEIVHIEFEKLSCT